MAELNPNLVKLLEQALSRWSPNPQLLDAYGVAMNRAASIAPQPSMVVPPVGLFPEYIKQPYADWASAFLNQTKGAPAQEIAEEFVPGKAVNAASKLVPNAARTAGGGSVSSLMQLLEGSPLAKVAGSLKNMKLGVSQISPAKANILAALAPIATEKLGLTDMGGIENSALGLGYLLFGPRAIAAGLPTAAMGKGLGDYFGTPDSDYATRAWLEFNPASKFKAQRVGQQPAQPKTIDVTPTSESTVVEEGTKGGKTKRSLMDKMIMADGYLNGKGDLNPAQLVSLRAKAASKLLEKTPNATDEEKMMLGAWIHGGASTFSDIVKEREKSNLNIMEEMLKQNFRRTNASSSQDAMMKRMLASKLFTAGPDKLKGLGFGDATTRKFPWIGQKQIDPVKLMQMIQLLNIPAPATEDTNEALSSGTME